MTMQDMTPKLSSQRVLYAWEIKDLKVANIGNYSDVVVQVNWQLTGSQLKASDQSVMTANCSGTEYLKFDPAKFTSYNELKRSDIANWMEHSLGLNQVRALQKQIKDQLDLQQLNVESKSLPW